MMVTILPMTVMLKGRWPSVAGAVRTMRASSLTICAGATPSCIGLSEIVPSRNRRRQNPNSDGRLGSCSVLIIIKDWYSPMPTLAGTWWMPMACFAAIMQWGL